MELFTFNIIELVLLSATGILFVIQSCYYWGIYNRIHRHNQAVKKGKINFSTELPPLSVIIGAKNESENLRKYLPEVLEQNYPNFEVIVVNDSSSDESEDILKIMEEKYPHLYHTFTPDSSRYISHRKLALTVGIKASKYDWLVFTEANCRPASKDWLKLMARNFNGQTGIVLGYSGYEKGRGWLSRKSCFDNLFHAMRYLGCALLGKPYMGIGRNLAYRKELFFRRKGYSAHLNLQRGEDNLFINEIATSQNTRIETDPMAVIRIQPLKSGKEWKEEKISYAATSRFFKGFQRYLIGGETFSRILFYGCFITLLIFSILEHQWITVGLTVLIYITRFIFQIIIFNKTAADLGDERFGLRLMLFDIIQPLYNFRFKLNRLIKRKSDFMRR